MERASRLLQHIATGAALNRQDEDVVILGCKRTPICKAKRGGFRDTPAGDLLEAVLRSVVEEAGIASEEVEDVVVGNVLADQGILMARTAQLLADIPHTVPTVTLNRQCASGLQAIMTVAGEIRTGTIDLGIGAGVESMSERSMDQIRPKVCEPRLASRRGSIKRISPGLADKSSASGSGKRLRRKLTYLLRAAKAQASNGFVREIVPTLSRVKGEDGELVPGPVVVEDDGIRPQTTAEKLGKLRPAFKPDGSTTAGNSSQVSDGAAAVLLASRRKARELGLQPRARIVASAVCGVPPDIMGIGPAVAIPKVLEKAGMRMDDIDVFEINEAFASQAVYCVEELGVPREKLNPRGGAIALGHPLGCTGARQVVTLIHYLEDNNLNTGIVSMCVGMGMGAAAIIALEH
ncbi:Acaa1a protein [Salpingoeca rosetta]|uniref:acetyl-CoA C-acyltransferase n=1 Tax=Salpingoeca rosetta (strain ATCC 50818 / BSB-021) TaxID=946362 RepID=F2TZQ6_SALR5|nr:Acaa1a protein [Salpingoeca rosetta]EGD79080.1 Acaa1a protein [Salpingoeca rosetta]|eukprot:XP_004998036.1 Acaa1a protein [Salpingoeca rosetta]